MRKRELDVFRTLLEERRHELINEASRTVDGMGETREQFPDPTDRALLEGNRNLLLRIRDRERKLITKIDEAFGRIDDGSYGKCEECDRTIAMRRHRARPVTTLRSARASLRAQGAGGVGTAEAAARPRPRGPRRPALRRQRALRGPARRRRLRRRGAVHASAPRRLRLPWPGDRAQRRAARQDAPLRRGRGHAGRRAAPSRGIADREARARHRTDQPLGDGPLRPAARYLRHPRDDAARQGRGDPADRCSPDACRQMPLFGLEYEGRRYDAGDKVGFVEATVAFALKRPELARELRPLLA